MTDSDNKTEYGQIEFLLDVYKYVDSLDREDIDDVVPFAMQRNLVTDLYIVEKRNMQKVTSMEALTRIASERENSIWVYGTHYGNSPYLVSDECLSRSHIKVPNRMYNKLAARKLFLFSNILEFHRTRNYNMIFTYHGILQFFVENRFDILLDKHPTSFYMQVTHGCGSRDVDGGIEVIASIWSHTILSTEPPTHNDVKHLKPLLYVINDTIKETIDARQTEEPASSVATITSSS